MIISNERKKPKIEIKPKIKVEFVEDIRNVASLLSQPRSLISTPSSSSSENEESKLPKARGNCILSHVSNQIRSQGLLPQMISRSHKYNLGSVYRQASIFANCVSSSTNISSSPSGSVEVMISEIDKPIGATVHLTSSLSPLGKISEGQSEESEEKNIQKIITQHKSLNNSKYSQNEEALNKTMDEVKKKYSNVKRDKEMQKLKVRLQILQGIQNGNPFY